MYCILINSKILTGGPKALIQLGGAIERSGKKVNFFFVDEESKLLYSDWVNRECESSHSYLFSDIAEVENQIFIIPETDIHKNINIIDTEKNKIFMYMLSLDNCDLFDIDTGSFLRNAFLKIKKLYKRKILLFKDIENKIDLILTQSRYSESFLKNEKVAYYYIGDYIDLENDNSILDECINFKKILTNGNKGKFYKIILKFFNKDFEIVELKGLKPNDVVPFIKSHSFYLDLGGQPGKDRLPRECLSLGLKVIVLQRGAAKNGSDFPYPNYMKCGLLDLLNIDKKIRELKKYNIKIHQVNLMTEKEEFEMRVRNLFENY